MLKEQCQVGMQVVFGRGRGEKTLGIVVKLNDKKAKVKTLENRGSRSQAGSEWGVPYSLMEPAEGVKVAPTLLEALRFARDKAPTEWDALMATEAGPVICEAWDAAK